MEQLDNQVSAVPCPRCPESVVVQVSENFFTIRHPGRSAACTVKSLRSTLAPQCPLPTGTLDPCPGVSLAPQSATFQCDVRVFLLLLY